MIKSFKKFYRQLFEDKLFIIKASGRIIEDKTARENMIENIKNFTENGIKVLLIYGGGAAIDLAMHDQGLIPTKIDGRRISSQDDIKIIKRTLVGDLGFKLSESMIKKNMPSTILNAIPPHWSKAIRRPKENGVLRFDGTLTDINANNIRNHFTSTNLAICPCLALTEDGTALNVNADNVAIELAINIAADKLILLTDIDGVMIDNKVQSVLTTTDITQLIKDNIVTDGMRVKLENCADAVRSGVQRVHILNGLKKDTLKKEIYTSEGIGTMIVRKEEKTKYLQQEIKEVTP